MDSLSARIRRFSRPRGGTQSSTPKSHSHVVAADARPPSQNSQRSESLSHTPNTSDPSSNLNSTTSSSDQNSTTSLSMKSQPRPNYPPPPPPTYSGTVGLGYGVSTSPLSAPPNQSGITPPYYYGIHAPQYTQPNVVPSPFTMAVSNPKIPLQPIQPKAPTPPPAEVDSGNKSMTRLIVGIDFGTTFSGVAYAFTRKNEVKEDIITEWPGAGTHTKQKVYWYMYFLWQLHVANPI